MNFNKLIEDVKRIQKETKKLYIYGAGFYGKDVYRVLKNNDIHVDGFLVTKEIENKTVFGVTDIVSSNIVLLYIAIPTHTGNTPKATKSDNESICTPKSFSFFVLFFFDLATLPSKVSHNPHNSRNITPI